MRHSVLVVEDQAETAVRLRNVINDSEEFSVCAVASSVRDAKDMLESCKPRIVLIDIGLPDGSGIDVIRKARDASWECDCLVFSVFGDEERVMQAIKAGAKGYVLKNDTSHQICSALRELTQGGSPMSPKIARMVLSVISSENADTGKNQINLTKRELDVLQLVAKGMLRQEIAAQLGITIGTVGNHINHIYDKLDVRSNVEAVVSASKKGLL